MKVAGISKKVSFKCVVLFSFFALLLSSCNYSEPQVIIVQSCAERLLDTSYALHARAKRIFASYYKTRRESELFYSWYATEDSTFMANSVRRCRDKKNKHFHAVKFSYAKIDDSKHAIGRPSKNIRIIFRRLSNYFPS